MERRYVFWNTPAGGLVGCLAYLVGVPAGIALVVVGGLAPWISVLALGPVLGATLWFSLSLDRRGRKTRS